MKKHIIAFLICSVFAEASAQNYTQVFDSVFQLTPQFGNKNFIESAYTNSTDSSDLYKFGAGLSLNTIGSAYTIKYRISNKCAFQTDLGIKYFVNLVKDEGGTSPVMLVLLDVAQNFLYQHRIAIKGNKIFYFLLGTGVSGGLTPYGPVTWKVGANPLLGLEIVLNKPRLSFQIDLRPGYAALLRTEKAQNSDEHPFMTALTRGIKQYPYHGYEISLNFAVRFYKSK